MFYKNSEVKTSLNNSTRKIIEEIEKDLSEKSQSLKTIDLQDITTLNLSNIKFKRHDHAKPPLLKN